MAFSLGKKVLHRNFLLFAGPPHVRQTSPVKAIEGHTLQIACPASGYPIEGILWKKGRQSKKLNKFVHGLKIIGTKMPHDTEIKEAQIM